MDLKGARKAWEKYKYVTIVALAGAALLLWLAGEQTAESAAADFTAAAAQTQAEMEDILSRISGAGELRLMLTVETDGERVLAQDTEVSYSGSVAAPEDYRRTSETVGGSGEEAVVVQTRYPTYRGALVVCQGGDRADVRLAVTEAVAALTGLSSDRITVAKWQ